MLSVKTFEKAIELFERGVTASAVAEATGLSPEEAKAVADALYVGETDRLIREINLAGVLELAAKALRSGQGLIGDSAADVVREIWSCYPDSVLKVREAGPAAPSDQDEIATGKSS